MKILHVLTSPRAEGTPRLVLDWLTVKEHQQFVLFLNRTPTDLLPLFYEACENVSINDTYDSFPIRKFCRIIAKVNRACKEFNPDVVISWNQGYSHWIILGARLAGVRKTIVHGGCEPKFNTLRSKLYNYYVHWPLYLMGTKLICASRFIESRFKQIPLLPKSNIFFAYNCFQIEKFLPPPKVVRMPIAIMVANLEPVKNHLALLKAWEQVLETLPEAKLWLVGRGSMREKLENYCQENKLEHSVVFWGERQDVPQLLWQARVFVFSSISEGFGTVLLEALAAGLRIVASDIAACKEVLQNGEYGMLVDVNNYQHMAKAIVDALKQPDLSAEEWQKNIEYVKQFSPAAMVDRYLEIVNKK